MAQRHYDDIRKEYLEGAEEHFYAPGAFENAYNINKAAVLGLPNDVELIQHEEFDGVTWGDRVPRELSQSVPVVVAHGLFFVYGHDGCIATYWVFQ